MKGCILLQGNYARIGHVLARHLKDNFQIDSFSAYVLSGRAKKVMEEQQDFKYTSFLFDEEVHESYKDEEVDVEYIQAMEAKYGAPNFWRYVYSDRRIIMSFDSLDNRTMEMKPLYSHREIQQIIQIRLKKTIAFLENDRPDFIIFFAIGTLGHMILYHVAKKMGIRVFVVDSARLGNYMTVTEDFNTFFGLQDCYQKLKSGQNASPHLDEARKVIADFVSTHSLSLSYMTSTVNQPSITLGNRFKTYYQIWREHALYPRAYKYATPASLWRFFGAKLIERMRKFRGYSDLYGVARPGEDFAFFPLHFEPETSLLNIAPFFTDQINVVSIIARSLPLNFKLYVKEHPVMVNKRTRAYYKKLLAIPNVVLVDPKVKSFDLIEKAKLVVTITSTTGWESVLLGKPVITFGNIFYNEYPAVKHCRTPEEMPDLVREQLTNFHHNKPDVELFLAALMDLASSIAAMP
jgi:capsule polysaccharide modification protein KpsS